MSQAKLLSTTLEDEFVHARPFLPKGDGMKATFSGPFDVAMIAPTDAFGGDGIYVVHEAGEPVLTRAQYVGAGQIRLSQDDGNYAVLATDLVTFEATVLGRVIGKVSFFDATAYQTFLDNYRI